MKKAAINPQDVEQRLKSESLRAIAKSYGITHQALSMRRRAWAKPLRNDKRRTTGAKFIDQWGYVMIRTADRFRVNPYVAEHVLVAEELLGRKLKQGEVVHHINGNKQDNAKENLFVCSRSEHRRLHAQLESLAFQLIQTGQICFTGGNYAWRSR